jgi:uncharacterized GH25 family protein
MRRSGWCSVNRRAVTACIVTVLSLFGAARADAHEFWLEAIDYRPKVGDAVPIVFRNGQNFVGDSFPYVRKLAKRLALRDARGDRTIKAIEGDDPAADVKLPVAGLAVVSYQSAPEMVTFEAFERFNENLIEEGLEYIAAEHVRLAKPQTGIRELFSRSAKALVDVGGTAAGGDSAIGLPIEIVVTGNPYRATAGDPLTATVLFEGKPLAGVLIKVFHGKDPQSPRRLRTDAEGRVSIPLPLPGEYLLSAVHMVPARASDKAHWSSLWASTTFSRP